MSRVRSNKLDRADEEQTLPLRAREPEPVHWLFSSQDILLIRSCGVQEAQSGLPFLTVFDQAIEPRVRVGLGQEATAPVHYLEAEGVEYLEQGMRVLGPCRILSAAHQGPLRHSTRRPRTV
jgi:hypothetical protein